MILLGCYEARKEASYWTIYGSGERTGITTNHIILYQMFTGHLPAGEALVSGSLPAPLRAVFQRCLAANPEDRYAGATHLLHAFELACQALAPSAAPPASQSTVLPLKAIVSLQPVDAQNMLDERKSREAGNMLSPQTDREFSEADYAAPTIDIAYTHVGKGPGANSQQKQSPAVAIGDFSVSVPGGKKLVRGGRSRQKPLFVVVSLLTIVVLFVMGGLIFLASPLVATASVTLGPQVHVLQQVYTITRPPH